MDSDGTLGRGHANGGRGLRRQRSLEWRERRGYGASAQSSSDEDDNTRHAVGPTSAGPRGARSPGHVFASLLVQQYNGDRTYRTGSDTEGAVTDNPTTPFPTPPPTLTPNHRQASPFPLESTNSRRHHYNGSVSSDRSRNGNGEAIYAAPTKKTSNGGGSSGGGGGGGTLGRRTRRGQHNSALSSSSTASDRSETIFPDEHSRMHLNNDNGRDSPPEPAPPEVPPRGPSLLATHTIRAAQQNRNGGLPNSGGSFSLQSEDVQSEAYSVTEEILQWHWDLVDALEENYKHHHGKLPKRKLKETLDLEKKEESEVPYEFTQPGENKIELAPNLGIYLNEIRKINIEQASQLSNSKFDWVNLVREGILEIYGDRIASLSARGRRRNQRPGISSQVYDSLFYWARTKVDKKDTTWNEQAFIKCINDVAANKRKYLAQLGRTLPLHSDYSSINISATVPVTNDNKPDDTTIEVHHGKKDIAESDDDSNATPVKQTVTPENCSGKLRREMENKMADEKSEVFENTPALKRKRSLSNLATSPNQHSSEKRRQTAENKENEAENNSWIDQKNENEMIQNIPLKSSSTASAHTHPSSLTSDGLSNQSTSCTDTSIYPQSQWWNAMEGHPSFHQQHHQQSPYWANGNQYPNPHQYSGGYCNYGLSNTYPYPFIPHGNLEIPPAHSSSSGAQDVGQNDVSPQPMLNNSDGADCWKNLQQL